MRIIAGKYKNRILKAPKGIETRPTSGVLREAVFNMIQQSIEGADFLDLFAGSGAMGFEALSRGANRAVFIDQSIEALKAIGSNIEELGLKGSASILRGDVCASLKKLRKLNQSFDIVYVDPPYFKSKEGTSIHRPESLKVLEEMDVSDLLKKGGVLFIEENKEVKLEETLLNTLKFVKKRSFGSSCLFHFIREED